MFTQNSKPCSWLKKTVGFEKTIIIVSWINAERFIQPMAKNLVLNKQNIFKIADLLNIEVQNNKIKIALTKNL